LNAQIDWTIVGTTLKIGGVRALEEAASDEMGSTMGGKPLITGRLIAAARALTGISHSHLSEACGLPVQTLIEMESAGSASPQSAVEAESVQRALEGFGAMFIPEGGGIGAGVRLKFLRQDVKQIGRLEGEGGLVREDDVP
jgi:hypothetical protein